MALPVISSRPEKVIDGITSRWNAANLPLQYQITNTKWPTNSEGTVAITSISDSGGYAKLNHGSSTGLVAKEWVLVAGTDDYDGAHQIRSVDGNNLVIDFPYSVSDTGTSQKYYNNYTTLIKVYAGLDPAHTWATEKPMTLIGTIEQRPDSDNVTYVDVRDYVKNQLNTNYDIDLASWPNDLNSWCDFYVSYAERYDLVTAGEVNDFTSAYTDDGGASIIYCRATNSALQFGNVRGGNMYDYAINNSPYDDLAIWMTDFARVMVIDDQTWNVSVILDVTISLLLKIYQYDLNGDIIQVSGSDFINLPVVTGNIGRAVYLQEKSISAQDNSPSDIFFKSDGLKMYMSGSQNDKIYEYDLGTAWDITTAVYLQSLDVSAKTTTPVDVYISSDGLKMYVLGVSASQVHEYDLGIAWDVTSGVWLQTYSITEDTGVTGITFKTDGTKMYIIGQTNDKIYEYNLSTAWDVSSALYLQSLGISSEDGAGTSIYFKSDGLKMYFVGDTNDKVYAYNLGVAWDISTAVYVQDLDISGEDNLPQGIFFDPDETKLYILGTSNDKVYEYDMDGLDVYRGLFRVSFDISDLESDTKYFEMAISHGELELSERITVDVL